MERKERKITNEDIRLAVIYSSTNEKSLNTTFACHETTPVRDLKNRVPSDSKVRASVISLSDKKEEFQQVPGERVFLWLTSESDVDKLASIGILNPVLIDPEDKRGVEIIAFVPRTLYSDMRAYSFD